MTDNEYVKATKIVMVAATLGLISWDVYVMARNPKERNTISEIALDLARKYPILAFSMGMLMGHLFWSQPHER